MNYSLPADLKRVAVLTGGASSEREVSFRTGARVQAALERLGYEAELIDIAQSLTRCLIEGDYQVAFLALHGGAGEDGTIQGFLETFGLPYTGSGVFASALGLHKLATKGLWRTYGLETPDSLVLYQGEKAEDQAARVADQLGLPVVVKPACEGSSVGVSICETLEELARTIRQVTEYYGLSFCERYIAGQEITVGVLGWGESLRALPVLELVPQGKFYDYEAKYSAGATDFILPARLGPEVTRQVQELAVEAHRLLGCHGYSRIDMQVSAEDNRPYLIEINTLPGLTDTSDLPAEAAEVGISYDQLVEEILASAFARNMA